MRGMASIPIRIRRLSERQYVQERDTAIAQAARDYDVDEAELRAEVLAWEERCQKYGPLSIDDVYRRTAAELGIDEADLRTEIDRMTAARRDQP
jgi:hypothetical protein